MFVALPFSALLTCALDVCYDHVPFTGYHTGYHDTEAKIDLNTYRQIPWEQNVPFFLADFSASSGAPAPCPRTVLRNVVKKAQGMGYEPLIGVEFEWFNYKETSQSIADKKFVDPTPLTPGIVYL